MEKPNTPILLHVEDDETTAYLLERAVKAVAPEIELIRVPDGDECLAFFRRDGCYRDASQPDAVVLDLNLPKRSGLEVLDALSRMYDLRCLPVVIFSGSLNVHREAEFLALGVRKLFSKDRGWNSFRDVAEFVCRMLRIPHA